MYEEGLKNMKFEQRGRKPPNERNRDTSINLCAKWSSAILMHGLAESCTFKCADLGVEKCTGNRQVQEGEESSGGSLHSDCESCRNCGPLCDRYVHFRILCKELITHLPDLLLILSVKMRRKHT